MSTGPQIGADEWVARRGERSGAGGPLDRARAQADRVPGLARFLGFFGLVALVPLMTSDQYIIRVGTVTLVFALLALGLNVAVGFAGILDLGFVAYYGVGAYGYAMLSSSKFGVHWPAWASIPAIVGISLLLGFLLALPSRRLVGDYLAIVTLFFGQIFFTLVSQGYRMSLLGFGGPHDITGGPNGIANVDRIHAFGATASSERAYFYVSLVAVVVVFAVYYLANRSRTGRAWRALHDDSLAAQVMSMPVDRLKILAVGVGACAGALAGTINAALIQGAFPDDYNTMVLITIYACLVLGGVGSLTGAVAGAIVINVLLEVLRTPDHARWLFYLFVLLAIVAKVRPWKRLAVVAVGAVAFGVIVHAIVGAAWPRGVHGLISSSSATSGFDDGGWLGWLLRHWLVLPAGTYQEGQYTTFNYLTVLLIAMALALTLLRGWKRDLLLVPTVWLAGLVWETRLIEEGSGATRFLMLGVILIVVMAARPQGLFGKPRVEIV
jgi:branched-chain amino acid transport system permease protein